MPETKLKRQAMNSATWTAVTFQNSWTNYSDGFQECQYTKDNNGWVHLRGLCKSGTVASAIFTLPVGFRPSSTLGFALDNGGVYGRIYIDSSGAVVLQTGGNNSWVFLDTIHFYAG